MLGKIQISFKCPDAVDHAIDNYLSEFGFDEDFFDNEENPDRDTLSQLVKDRISKFVKWGEVITVKIDLDNNTARVCQC
jgi:hypothetical protein